MGDILKYSEFQKVSYVNRLVIYHLPVVERSNEIVSINKLIAAELVQWSVQKRTLLLERSLIKVLLALPGQPILIDIDVLFNPAYKVDVMKLLTSAYKQKRFSLVWPGTYADGKLIYSEEGYPDYRVYEIKDYDIMYVI